MFLLVQVMYNLLFRDLSDHCTISGRKKQDDFFLPNVIQSILPEHYIAEQLVEVGITSKGYLLIGTGDIGFFQTRWKIWHLFRRIKSLKRKITTLNFKLSVIDLINIQSVDKNNPCRPWWSYLLITWPWIETWELEYTPPFYHPFPQALMFHISKTSITQRYGSAMV